MGPGGRRDDRVPATCGDTGWAGEAPTPNPAGALRGHRSALWAGSPPRTPFPFPRPGLRSLFALTVIGVKNEGMTRGPCPPRDLFQPAISDAHFLPGVVGVRLRVGLRGHRMATAWPPPWHRPLRSTLALQCQFSSKQPNHRQLQAVVSGILLVAKGGLRLLFGFSLLGGRPAVAVGLVIKPRPGGVTSPAAAGC